MLNRAVLATIFAALATAQTADQTRVFTFSHTENPQQMQQISNAVRAVGNIRIAFPKASDHTFTVTGTTDQLALTDWLLTEVDRSASAPPKMLVAHEYSSSDPRNPVIKVYFPARTTTPQQLQEALNTIRSIADVQRVVAISGSGAIILRGTPDQVALADWLLRELDQPAPGATHEYRVPGWTPGLVRAFFLPPATTPQELQSKADGVRGAAQIPRVTVYLYDSVILARGTDEQMAVAERLLR
jgi:hypothetical protein